MITEFLNWLWPFSITKDMKSKFIEEIRSENINEVKKFITYKNIIDIQDEDGNTPLIISLKDKQHKIAELLIRAGADTQIKNNEGNTALDLARKNDNSYLIKLIANQSKILKLPKLSLDLLSAAKRGNLEKVKDLLSKGAEIDVQDPSSGDTPLLISLKNNHKEVATLLINEGASPNIRDKDGYPPLVYTMSTFYGTQGGFKDNNLMNLLLNNGADPYAKDNSGNNLFIWYGFNTPRPKPESIVREAKSGNIENVKRLLEQGTAIEFKNNKNETALIASLKAENYEMAKLLIEKGASIHAEDKEGISALDLIKFNNYFDDLLPILHNFDLIYQTHLGSVENIKQIIALGYDLNIQDEDGNTPLIISLKDKQHKIAELLIRAGADTQIEDNEGNSILDLARKNDSPYLVNLIINQSNILARNKFNIELLEATKKGDLEKVKDLLSKGAEINVQDPSSGDTPLLISLKNKHKNIAEFLINEGADPNIGDKYGYPPLAYAMDSKYGDSNLQNLLLDNGADPYAKDSNGKSLFIWFGTPNKYEGEIIKEAKLGNLTKVQELANKGYSIDFKNKAGDTALLASLKSGQYEVVKFLLEGGADATIEDKNGISGLDLIKHNNYNEFLLLTLKYELIHQVKLGNITKVKELIEQNADINISNKSGDTPLLVSLKLGYKEITDMLIKAGADTNKSDVAGITPLYIAVVNQDLDLVKLLVDKGADPNIKVDNKSLLRIAAADYNKEILKFLDDLIVEKPGYFLNAPYAHFIGGGLNVNNSANLDHTVIKGKEEYIVHGYKLNVNYSQEELNNTAYWQQFHIEVHNSNHKIGKALFIDANDLLLDHTKIDCPNIYVVEDCKVTNIDSILTSPIKYVTEEQLNEIYNSYIE
ncbi:MAG: ankyrin repeat domain-containing protein [Sphingobacteriia bacterium]|nr:ankyrin repeat domain-containing protein [Sphingobacteriia bacterium]